MAKLIIHEARRLNETEIIDVKLWEVPVTKDDPDGVTYSINYRLFDKNKGKWRSLIRYDNAHRYKNHKSKHRRHVGNNVKEIEFKDLDTLYHDMLRLIQKFKKQKKIDKMLEVKEWEE